MENQPNPTDKPPILVDHLLNLLSNGEIDAKMVQDQIETIFMAGNDTTATTLSFVILMLAMHPEIQERVYEELRSVFVTQDEETTNAHLNQMPYTDSVLSETLRLFPAGPLSLRTATKDIEISSCTIPKDTLITLSIFSLHRVWILTLYQCEFYNMFIYLFC